MSTRVILLNGRPGGGVGRYLLQVAAGLPPRFDVTIVGDPLPEFDRAAAALERPVRLVRVPCPARGEPGAVVRYARLFRALGADLVHTQDPRSQLYGHLAARLVGAGTVHTVHMSPLYFDDHGALKAALYRGIQRLSRRTADATIFVSQHERGLYAAHGLVEPTRARVIYNGLDAADLAAGRTGLAEARAAVRRRLGLDAASLLVTFAGRLAYQKGLDHLLEAVPRVLAHVAPVHFVLAGDGPEREALEVAAARSAPGHVRFVGHLERPALFELLKASDVFTLPSRFECFPYATLEALAAGLPCVVTDVGGNREAIADGVNGLVVPPGDVEALAAALIAVLASPELRAGLQAETRATAGRFLADEMVLETAAVYDAVLPPLTPS